MMKSRQTKRSWWIVALKDDYIQPIQKVRAEQTETDRIELFTTLPIKNLCNSLTIRWKDCHHPTTAFAIGSDNWKYWGDG
jgi:hypothetical protein